MDEQGTAGWPQPLARLLARFRERSRAEAVGLSTRLGFALHVSQEEQLASFQRLADLASSARAVITAYAHVIQEPRPSIAEIARAQGVSPSGLRRRYTEVTVEALRSLIGDTPDVQAIRRATVGLTDQELFGISSELDRALLADGVPRPTLEARFIGDDRATPHPFFVDVEDLVVTGPVGDYERSEVAELAHPAATLLGLVVETLRGALSTARWTDGWTDPARAKYEWSGGPQVSQVVAILVPRREEGAMAGEAPTSGLFGLRLRSHTESQAEFTWAGPDGDVNLLLRRYPVA